MNSKEIRSAKTIPESRGYDSAEQGLAPSALAAIASAQWLKEIAAQLAELNERLDRVTGITRGEGEGSLHALAVATVPIARVG
jgi:hypothetical protein